MTDDSDIHRILADARTIAVVGASDNPARASFGVMKFVQAQGYRIIPVNPRLVGSTILGEPVYAALADIPDPFDMVDIFRKPEDVPPVVDSAVALKAARGIRVIWMQLGIRNDAAAAVAEAAGLAVVMDRCLAIELRRIGGRPKLSAG